MIKIEKFEIFGCCSDLGVHVNGANLAPKILIDEFIKTYQKINYQLLYSFKEIKDLDKNNLKKNINELNIFNKSLYSLILQSINDSNFPITIGGDHSIAIASSLASIKKHENLGIIWFDAHGDFNTFETTTSGNIHGLPLAVATNYEKNLLSSFHNGNFYNPKNSVILGGRDIDIPGELQNIKDSGVTIISTDEIHKIGIENATKKAFEIALNGTNGIHISYDIDVIDPNFAPGVSIPAKDGITIEEGMYFAKFISENLGNIKSFDLVEYNPLKDKNNITKKIALDILHTIIK